MYAFAIWDRQEKELFLARDRMGVKPLYYHKDGNRLIFASEIRGILATGLVSRKLDHAALVEYFSYQSVSHPLSPIEGIRQLAAGSWMKVKNGETRQEPYWDVTDAGVDFDFSDSKRVQKKIRDLMLQSVERRMLSDVPVGAFLSGGIDSSAVVGLMARTGRGRPNSFNIAFEEKEFDESSYADIVAKKFNTEHTRIVLKPTVLLDELENALNAMDTPSGDGINTYVVSEAIRHNGMTVALSGIGGDELFAGYPFFKQYLRLRAGGGGGKCRSRSEGWPRGACSAGNTQGTKGKIRQILELPSVSIDHVYPIFRQILSPRCLCELTSLTDQGHVITAVEKELASRKPATVESAAAEPGFRCGIPRLYPAYFAEGYGSDEHGGLAGSARALLRPGSRGVCVIRSR